MDEDSKKKLLNISDEMAELKKRLYEIGEHHASKIRKKLGIIDAQLVKDIAFATDENGNRIYSNDKIRRAELTLRKSKNEEYQKLLKKLRDLRDKEMDLAIQYNKLVDQKAILMSEIGLDSNSDKNHLLIP